VASALREAPKHETWRWLNYGSLLLISAVLPFAIAVGFLRKLRLFPWLLGASMLYAVSLLPKSYVIVIVVPLAVLLAFDRAWTRLVALAALCLVLVLGLSWVATPQTLHAPPNEHVHELGASGDVARYGVLGNALLKVSRRVVLTPGWTLAAWFEHIPADIPWCEGAAVRPLALLLGEAYVDIPSRMYELEYPEHVARGIHGTVPSAAFMYDYANFAGWGLVLAGALAASTFVLLDRWVGLRGRWAVVFGAYPLMALAVTGFTTVLLSHGLLAVALLFTLYRPDRIEAA
jgi:hypothetical protein